MYPKSYPATGEYVNATHVLFGNADKGAYINPYADMVRGYKESNNLLVAAQAELKQKFDFVTKGLDARILVSTTRSSYSDLTRAINPYYYQADYDKETNSYTLTNIVEGEEYLSYNQGSRNINTTNYVEAAISYNRTFGVHATSGMLVYTRLVEIGDDLLGQLLVSHVGALLLLPKEGLEMVVNSQILVVGGLGSLPFLHHRPELPVHVPEVFQYAVLHHADTEEGVAQFLGGDEILFPEDAVVVVGEPGGDLLQLPVYLVCLGGLAFRLAVLPEVGGDEQLGSHRLVIPVNGDFHHDGGFPVPVSHCGSLDVERGRKRTSLCFHNSKIFVSKGSYLFLTKSYAKQGKAMKQNSLCRIYPISEPVAV